MAEEIDGLHVKFSADVEDLNNGVKESQDAIGGFLGNIKAGLADWGLNTEKFTEEAGGLFKRFGVDIDKFSGKFGVSSEMMLGMAAVGVAVFELGKQIFEVG